MKQMFFADAEYAAKRKQTRRQRFLIEMDQVVHWKALLDKGLLQPHFLAKYVAAFFKMSHSSVTRGDSEFDSISITTAPSVYWAYGDPQEVHGQSHCVPIV